MNGKSPKGDKGKKQASEETFLIPNYITHTVNPIS